MKPKLILKKLKYNKLIQYVGMLLSVVYLLACSVINKPPSKSYKYFIVFERKRTINENKHLVTIHINYYIVTEIKMSLKSLAKNLAEGHHVRKSNLFSVVDKGDYKSLTDCGFPYTIDYNDKLGSVLYQIFYIGHGNPIFNNLKHPYDSIETEILIGEVKCKNPIVPLKKKYLDCVNRNRLLLLSTEDNYFNKVNDTLSIKYSITNFNPTLSSVFLSPSAVFNDIDTVLNIH